MRAIFDRERFIQVLRDYGIKGARSYALNCGWSAETANRALLMEMRKPV